MMEVSAAYAERMSLIMWELKWFSGLIALLVVNGHIMCVHLAVILSLVNMYAILISSTFLHPLILLLLLQLFLLSVVKINVIFEFFFFFLSFDLFFCE